MTTFNLLLLVFDLVFSTKSLAAPDGSSSQTVLYDELLFVLQWPNSFCSTNKCYGTIPPYFTVHGLWLNMNSESVNCCSRSRSRSRSSNTIELSPQISEDLRNKMDKCWPNLLNNTHPESFWLSEYAKHGSCIPEFQNQVDYFQKAIDFATKIGVGDGLEMTLSAGQALQMGKVYEVTNFDNVTIAGETFNPSLRCNKADGRQYPQLLEIVFCTDIYNKPKNCTPTNRMVCSGQFELPQESAFSPSSSRSPPEPECSSAIPRALPLPQFTHFLLQIFLLSNIYLIYFI